MLQAGSRLQYTSRQQRKVQDDLALIVELQKSGWGGVLQHALKLPGNTHTYVHPLLAGSTLHFPNKARAALAWGCWYSPQAA